MTKKKPKKKPTPKPKGRAVTLPGMKEIFKEKDPPETVRAVIPPPTPDTVEVFEEPMPDGRIRVMRREAPGCAATCIDVKEA